MASSSSAECVVLPVSDRQSQKAFLALPLRLYANDPNWVAPLEFEQKQRIFGHNPFFEHAECQAWLAWRDGRSVGRITAQIDALYEQYQHAKVGYFGMLEAENDPHIFAALLATAEAWLRERGVEEVQGPFNLSINEEVGLLVEGFDSPPFIMMGHAPAYYQQALEALGYHKVKDMVTYLVDPAFASPRVMTRLVKKADCDIQLRSLDLKRKTEEFELLRDIFNDAWSGNWGFVPFTRAEFDEVAKSLAILMNKDSIQIAEIDGRPVAFIVALPNINEAIKDFGGRLLPFGWAKLLWRLKVRFPQTARVPLMGVRREFHHTVLGPALAFMIIDTVRQGLVRRGVKQVEVGWILENNAGMRNIIETIGGVDYKKYRVYGKQLTPAESHG